MVRFNWIIGWCLACFFGLISFSSFAATGAPTKPASYAACLASAERSLTAGATDAKCVFKELTPATGPDRFGGYFCVQYFRSGNGTGTSASFGYCSNSASSTSFCSQTNANTSQVCKNSYDSYTPVQTTVAQSVGLNNNAFFFWLADEDECLTVPDLDPSGFRAPTSNGTGTVCHDGCAYSVAVGYEGTWPVGKVFHTAQSLKRQCQPSDADSTTDPLPSDTPPLDIDGETPDPGPEPGDGDKPGSSGGGTCDDPPKCQGDSIQCNLLYQTWANRCKSGNGGEPGQPVDLKGVENRLDTIAKNQVDAWRGGDDIGPGSDGDFSDLGQTRKFTTDDLDTSGFGFPRSCNFFEPIVVPVGFTSVNIDFANSPVCAIFTWSGYFVVALAAFMGCYILIKD